MLSLTSVENQKNTEADKFKKWMGKMKISGILVTEEE